MKYKLYLFLVLGLFLSFKFEDPFQRVTRKPFELPKGITERDYLPNTIIFKLKTPQRKSAGQMALPASQYLDDKGIRITSVNNVFPTSNVQRNTGRQVSANMPETTLDNIFVAKYEGGSSIVEVINTLLKDEQVVYAEPSYIHYIQNIPNDPLLNNQVYFEKMQVKPAWGLNISAANILVAIVDSGSELAHEDLAANIYYNQKDPVNGRDDDGDGYIDNYAGWDFVGLSASTMIADNDPNVTSDTTQHGVHVSGLVSAVSNNSKGIASIARDAKLLIVKTGADNNARSIYKGYEGIKYAVDMGAHIINCSWGSVASGQFGLDIVNYAVSKGALIVASAGNSNHSLPNYPASYPGVISVSALGNNDVKASFSNFGDKVDIAAPGVSILSTLTRNRYGNMSGTSMAAPIVSSAAALLWAKNPNMTGEQIGEYLRMASDPVNDLNGGYPDLLGKGRVNILNALQNRYYSVRSNNIRIQDPSQGTRNAGSELGLILDLKNYLDPVTGLNVQISSLSPYLEVLTPNLSIGNINSLAGRTNIGPVRVRVLPNAPANQEVTLKLTYSGNGASFQESELFSFEVALDFLNVTVNKIGTSFSSNGRVGYSKEDATGGIGFIYKDESMLYEASLLIAKSVNQVSNNARGDGKSSDDFQKIEQAKQVLNSDAAFEATATFDDSKAMAPINIQVKSRVQAYNQAPNDKFVLVHYELTNTSAVNIEGIYTALFMDWDLDNSTNNATKFDPLNQLAYAYATKNASYPYVGVKLLSLKTNPIYVPFSYQISTDPLADGKFTNIEKYAALRGGVPYTELGTDGDGMDIMYMLGSGPYQIPAGKSVVVSYAFVAGDNQKDLEQVAQQAQIKHIQNLEKDKIIENINAINLGQNFPNPVVDQTQIPVKLPESANVKLQVSDLQGRVVKTLWDGKLDAGMHNIPFNVSGLAPGIYIYELRVGSYKKSLKMVITR